MNMNIVFPFRGVMTVISQTDLGNHQPSLVVDFDADYAVTVVLDGPSGARLEDEPILVHGISGSAIRIGGELDPLL